MVIGRNWRPDGPEPGADVVAVDGCRERCASDKLERLGTSPASTLYVPALAGAVGALGLNRRPAKEIVSQLVEQALAAIPAGPG